ncbi:MAG: uracil-DNA glycosylase [Candidatus Omnitrophica bacterium]|nr:uracil-DNA glycosylase [Candidatus Omnitrophota bacterium]
MKEMKDELKQIIRSVKMYMETERLCGIEDFFVQPLSYQRTLEQLEQEVSGCRQCPLYKSRKNPVFGQGNQKAQLVFVGEAPGRDEDEQGQPFVGRAGELLTRIIQAMGFKRQDVYICNVLKCRPPENRNPLPTEIFACRGYLLAQLDIIKPKVICCMGKFACHVLLGEDVSISKVRGKFHDYNGVKLMPTFHPAYLLRNPGAKGLVWQDMQKVMTELKK